MKFCYASIAVAMSALVAVGCGSKSSASSDTFVTINGDAVSSKDYLSSLEHKTSVLVSGQQGPQKADVALPLGLQALRDMVDEKVVLDLAKADNLLPTDADVTKEIDYRTSLQPDYVKIETSAGFSGDALKNKVKYELARSNVFTKGVTVPMAEVDTFIKENPKQFTQPASANLSYVLVNDKAKTAEVDKDLAAGAKFETVVAKYGGPPQPRDTRIDEMPPVVKAAVQKTPEHKTTDWIPVNKAFIKLMVNSKTPDKPVLLTAAQKESLHRQMVLQRAQLTSDLEKRVVEGVAKATVTISDPLLKEQWSKMTDQMKKELQASAAATAPPTGAATTGGTGIAPGGGAATAGGGVPKPGSAPAPGNAPK